MPNKIKMIAVDLDGTLLNSNGEIGEKTKRTLNEIMKSGVKVIPVSGRSIDQIPQWLTSNEAIEYIGCSNGASVYSNKTKSIVYERLLGWDVVDDLMHRTEEYHSFVTLIVDGAYYSFNSMLENDYGDNQDYMKELSFGRTFVDTYDEVKEVHAVGAEKVHFGFIDMSIKEEADKAVVGFTGAAVTSSHYSNIEISHEEASKGAAVSYLLDYYGFKPSELIVCGDNLNDESMLQVSDIKVVMQSAPKEMLDYSTYTASNDNDELASLLMKLLELED